MNGGACAHSVLRHLAEKDTLAAAGTKAGSKPGGHDTWVPLAGRPLLIASLEAVPGKTRRTEF